MFILLEISQKKSQEVFSTPQKPNNFKKRVKRIQKRKVRVIDSMETVARKLDFSLIGLQPSAS